MPPRRGHKALTHEQRTDKVAEAIRMHELGFSQRDIAIKLNVSQPTVSIWLRKASQGLPLRRQDRIAAKIRAELVCCDIYQRMEDTYDPEDDSGWKALRHSRDYHDICFHGEWAARIAESVR